MNLRTTIACATLAVVVLGACGDGGGRFDPQVDAVRSAVDAGDRDAAELALDELAFAAGAAASEGDLSDAAHQEIVESIASSRALLDEAVPTTAAPTTTTTTTAPAPTPPEKEPKDKGKGHKGDDRDD
ncbi:hypothetical protein [Actinospongicola halichondriae]|uniref:hypothetical protein n=1 Tax=Actinospongicola halichondriae TaxID=3236844 RepID=UPI003D438F1C